MLELNKINKIYSNKKVLTNALNDVTLYFEDKGLVFLLGKSGSGKSTLLNIIGGIDTPTSGEILIDDNLLNSFNSSALDAYRNTYVGIIFQEYNLLNSYTVGENIMLALEMQGKNCERKQVDEILKQVDLVDEKGNTLYDRRIYELSGGQKQRVAIARAIIKDPQVILADEPTGAVDSTTGELLYELLKTLSRDRLIIVVTHDRENAERYGDRIVELADGKVIRDTVPTNDKKVSKENLSFSKGCLPLKRKFFMALHGLYAKPIRLILSMILTIVSLVAFGFSTVAMAMDSDLAQFHSMEKEELQFFTVKSLNDTFETLPTGTYKMDAPLSIKQVDRLKEYGDIVPLVDTRYIFKTDNDFGRDADLLRELRNESLYYNCFSQSIETCVVINEQSAETLQLKADDRFLDPTLCRIPQGANEIAITDMHANMFMELGYKGDGEIISISTPDDLIGKDLGGRTICGVFSTEIDRTYFEENKEVVDSEKNAFMRSYYVGARYSILNFAFVSEQAEFVELDKGLFEVLVKMRGNAYEALQIIESLQYQEAGEWYEASYRTVYTEAVLDSIIMKYITGIALSVGIGLGIFATLLMTNFLMISMDSRKHEIGVLRALGASRSDISGICLLESLLITFVNLILSIVITAIICFALNEYFVLTLFNFSVLQIGMMLALCFLVAIIATFISILYIIRKMPVEIIRAS